MKVSRGTIKRIVPILLFISATAGTVTHRYQVLMLSIAALLAFNCYVSLRMLQAANEAQNRTARNVVSHSRKVRDLQVKCMRELEHAISNAVKDLQSQVESKTMESHRSLESIAGSIGEIRSEQIRLSRLKGELRQIGSILEELKGDDSAEMSEIAIRLDAVLRRVHSISEQVDQVEYRVRQVRNLNSQMRESLTSFKADLPNDLAVERAIMVARLEELSFLLQEQFDANRG